MVHVKPLLTLIKARKTRGSQSELTSMKIDPSL